MYFSCLRYLQKTGPEEEINDYFEFFDYLEYLGISWHILELWTAGIAD